MATKLFLQAVSVETFRYFVYSYGSIVTLLKINYFIKSLRRSKESMYNTAEFVKKKPRLRQQKTIEPFPL